jgi:predicted nucleic acid-binding protein
MTTQHEYLKEGFELWQSYSQGYADFVVEATQQTLEQTLLFRERMGQVMAETVKKAETLKAQERGVALDLAAAFNAQTQIAAEQTAEMFKAFSALATAPLFSNWAAERAAQMSAAAAPDRK